VEIKDTGVGIGAENIEKLFRPFSQIEESAHMNKNGVGLSLHICKKIVRRLNGQVGVNSVLGRGSTFKFAIHATSCD